MERRSTQTLIPWSEMSDGMLLLVCFLLSVCAVLTELSVIYVLRRYWM
jgi:hypothetical protein